MVFTVDNWVAKQASSSNYFPNREESQQLSTVNSSFDGTLLVESETGGFGQQFLLFLLRFDHFKGILIHLGELLLTWRC